MSTKKKTFLIIFCLLMITLQTAVIIDSHSKGFPITAYVILLTGFLGALFLLIWDK